MAGAAEADYPPPGVKASGSYGYDPSSGLWLPFGGTAQGDGTVALKVTGAGITPTATSLKLQDAGGANLAAVDANGSVHVNVTDFPATQAVSEAHLPNLDIALSALRDAITKTGATAKTLADVVTALAATLTVQFPSAQAVTPPHLSSATDSVSVTGTVTVVDSVPLATSAAQSGNWTIQPLTQASWDARGLAERMLAKAPQSGYHLWLDVTSSDTTHIFIAEAPDGTASSAAAFRGARVTLDASGNPLGAVMTATGFAWDNRATATWAA